MGYDLYSRKTGTRFVIGHEGMRQVRRAMADVGMGTWTDAPKVPCDPEDRFSAAWHEVLAAIPDGCAGVALHKFESNDLWLVTAAECREALAAYDAMPIDALADFLHDLTLRFDPATWHHMLDALREGAEGDGFEVW